MSLNVYILYNVYNVYIVFIDDMPVHGLQKSQIATGKQSKQNIFIRKKNYICKYRFIYIQELWNVFGIHTREGERKKKRKKKCCLRIVTISDHPTIRCSPLLAALLVKPAMRE